MTFKALSAVGIYALAITFGLALAGKATAQGRPPPPSGANPIGSAEVDANGRCDLQKYGVTVGPNDSWPFTFVVDPTFLADPKFVRNSTPTGGGRIARKPQAFERVDIIALSTDPDRTLALVRLRNPDMCGWMPRSALLWPKPSSSNDDPLVLIAEGPLPLKMREFSRNSAMKQNDLFVKAVLHNSQGAETVEVPYYLDLGKTRRGTERQFNILDVFDRRSAPDPETGRTIEFYLLGRQSGQLLGWVRDRDVYIWPSRMSVYWAGTKQGFAFTREDMKGTPDIRETGEEPRERNVRRFPVIGQDPSSEELSNDKSFREATPQDRKRRIRRIEIVFPAEACPRDSTDASKCVSAEVLDQRRRELDARIGRLKTVDVLLLIDGTESMEPYLRAAAAAVANVVSSTSSRQDLRELTLRVGAFVYGDYRGNVSDQAFEPIVPLLDPRGLPGGGMDALAKVDAIRTKIGNDPQIDLLEAPFAAIIRAAKTAGWRPEAETRIIIHIADNGNRDYRRTSRDTMAGKNRDGPCHESDNATLIETLQVSDVVNALAENHVLYVPVNVLGRVDPRCGLPYANTIFIEQARAIFTQLLRRFKPGIASDLPQDPVLLSYDPKQLRETEYSRLEKITSALRRAFDLAFVGPAKITAERLCASDPESEGCKRSQGMLSSFEPIVTTVFEATRERAVGKDTDVKSIGELRQVVRRGFAPLLLPNGREQFTYWVALDPETLQSLNSSISNFCVEFENLNKRTIIIKDLLGRTTQGQSGEQLSLSDALAKRYSVPLNIESPYLMLDLNTLMRMAKGDSDNTKNLGMSLCKSRQLLTGVRRSGWRTDPAKMLCPPPKPGCDSMKELCVTCAVADGQSWPYEWEWTDGGTLIIYVPLNYLP